MICPITGCTEKSKPDCIIEFTIDGVEGIIKAQICPECLKKVSYGVISGISLAPKFTPAIEKKSY